MRALTSRSPPPPLHTPPATSFWFNIHPRSQTPRFGLGKRGAAFANLQSNPYMYMPYRNSHSLSLLLQPQEASSPALNNHHHHSLPPPHLLHHPAFSDTASITRSNPPWKPCKQRGGSRLSCLWLFPPFLGANNSCLVHTDKVHIRRGIRDKRESGCILGYKLAQAPPPISGSSFFVFQSRMM